MRPLLGDPGPDYFHMVARAHEAGALTLLEVYDQFALHVFVVAFKGASRS